MLTGAVVLIVEDGGLIGLDLAMTVEDLHGLPIVVSTVTEGLREIAADCVSAAIVDAQLPDGEVTPLAVELITRGIPFVVHTGGTLTKELQTLLARHVVVPKPTPSSDVIVILEREILGTLRDLGTVLAVQPRRC